MYDLSILFLGRILNRFSKDTGHMDDLLPITLFDFIQVSHTEGVVSGLNLIVIAKPKKPH
jgi:hypothetical protein